MTKEAAFPHALVIRSFLRHSSFGDSSFLLAQHPGENQGRANRGVAFDHELRSGGRELAPGDFLVRHRARVAAVARRRIADLAEITPQRHAGSLEILVQHWDDANRKIAGDAAADLEKTN